METIIITLDNNKKKEYVKGIKLKEIIEQEKDKLTNTVVGALYNNNMIDYEETLTKNGARQNKNAWFRFSYYRERREHGTTEREIIEGQLRSGCPSNCSLGDKYQYPGVHFHSGIFRKFRLL